MEYKRAKLTNQTVSHGKQTNPRKSKFLYIYWIFAILRIVLCLIPQNGYIHPDEFFQSIEVISGKKNYNNVCF